MHVKTIVIACLSDGLFMFKKVLSKVWLNETTRTLVVVGRLLPPSGNEVSLYTKHTQTHNTMCNCL